MPVHRPGLQVGDSAVRDVLLTADDIVRHATEFGDTNPLHHDDALARASRFGALIASGAHLTALLTGLLGAFTTSRGPGVGLEVSYQFHRAARPGDALRLRWEVVGVAPSAKLGGDVLSLAGEIREQRGGVILVRGLAKVLNREL